MHSSPLYSALGCQEDEQSAEQADRAHDETEAFCLRRGRNGDSVVGPWFFLIGLHGTQVRGTHVRGLRMTDTGAGEEEQ